MWISNFFELFELYYILNFFRPFLDFKLISSNFTTMDIAIISHIRIMGQPFIFLQRVKLGILNLVGL